MRSTTDKSDRTVRDRSRTTTAKRAAMERRAARAAKLARRSWSA